MFLMTVTFFNMVHILQDLNLVGLSWQFVLGDIFSSHLWAFGYYFGDI